MRKKTGGKTSKLPNLSELIFLMTNEAKLLMKQSEMLNCFANMLTKANLPPSALFYSMSYRK